MFNFRKLIKQIEFQADFKGGDEAFLNCCRLFRDNSLLATGGDDCKVRVFKLNPNNQFKPDGPEGSEVKPILTLEGHCDSINCVDFSPNGKLLVSSSSDCSCLIFNIDQQSKFKG